jgi:S1-C subfamily serine protease
LLAAVIASVSAGCVPAPPDARPLADPTERVPAVQTVLKQDGYERFAREITYRVRNPGCSGVGLGSAFALSSNLLVTNQHVVDDGMLSLELSTWDGREVLADVSAVSTWADIALVTTVQPLPVVATIGSDPVPGQPVAAVGFPLGGQWTLTVGEVVDLVPAEVFDTSHPVVRFDAPIRQGNSGGPLLDEDGKVVGVVFAIELEGDRLSLAIPVSTLEDELQDRSFVESSPSC